MVININSQTVCHRIPTIIIIVLISQDYIFRNSFKSFWQFSGKDFTTRYADRCFMFICSIGYMYMWLIVFSRFSRMHAIYNGPHIKTTYEKKT